MVSREQVAKALEKAPHIPNRRAFDIAVLKDTTWIDLDIWLDAQQANSFIEFCQSEGMVVDYGEWRSVEEALEKFVAKYGTD